MTYRIRGLSPVSFAPLLAADPADLARRGAIRVIADSDQGYPCRVGLVDARAGEALLLLHHTHQDVATPFRASHAIYVRTAAREAADHIDSPPPVFARRTLSLRGFTAGGMLHAATLAPPGTAHAAICALLAAPAIAYIHAHNAAYGCFLAAVSRHGADA